MIEGDFHDIPEEVVELLAAHIFSVEQLEILLMLRAQPAVAWSAKAVSSEARTSERSARARLSDLAARGFATVEDASEPLYTYAPVNDHLRRAVDLLAAAYDERRYTIIELIFSKPIANLRVYANAFRFRRDDSDG